MMRFFLYFLISAILSACATPKNSSRENLDDILSSGASVRGITPIFNQLVSIMQPKGFLPAFEDAKANFYIQEWVLRGETVDKWTQMITITGNKNLSLNPQATPQNITTFMAQGFKNSCPTSYEFKNMGAIKIGQYDGATVVVSCGILKNKSNTYSETTLIISIKGDRDNYSIQWAERGQPSSTPISIDTKKWQSRLGALGPIKLCPRIPGEAAPYPSCV